MSHLTDEALNVQLGLIQWHQRSLMAPRYYDAKLELEHGDKPWPAPWSGETITHTIGVVLDNAETFAVTTDMVELLQAGAASIPPFPLQLTDLPVPVGFAYFENKVIVPDRKGQPLAVKAFAWSSARMASRTEYKAGLHIAQPEDVDQPTAVWIVLFTDPRDPSDMNYADFREVPHDITGPLVYISDFPWEVGLSFDDLTESILEVDPALTNETPVELIQESLLLRIVCTFFRTVMEPWVDNNPTLPSRAVRRRRERASVLIPEDHVRVITLRKAREGYVPPPPQDGEDDEPYYHYRFPVRGHWRNQWYPSQKRHAPKWIPTFWKGPEGAPIINADHVFEWRR